MAAIETFNFFPARGEHSLRSKNAEEALLMEIKLLEIQE